MSYKCLCVCGHLEVYVEAILLPGDHVPGAAEPGVQLPLQEVGNLGVVPVELLHGGHQHLHHLGLHILNGQ